MRILVWKCHRWMTRHVYADSWWEEHLDVCRPLDAASASDASPPSRESVEPAPPKRLAAVVAAHPVAATDVPTLDTRGLPAASQR